jgi:hypothetical protein
LANSVQLRSALASSHADLAVIVSDTLYQSVVRQYTDLIPIEDYEEGVQRVRLDHRTRTSRPEG